MDGGGTTPRTEEVEPRQEQRSGTASGTALESNAGAVAEQLLAIGMDGMVACNASIVSGRSRAARGFTLGRDHATLRPIAPPNRIGSAETIRQ